MTEPKICPRCNAMNRAEARFCSACGIRFSDLPAIPSADWAQPVFEVDAAVMHWRRRPNEIAAYIEHRALLGAKYKLLIVERDIVAVILRDGVILGQDASERYELQRQSERFFDLSQQHGMATALVYKGNFTLAFHFADVHSLYPALHSFHLTLDMQVGNEEYFVRNVLCNQPIFTLTDLHQFFLPLVEDAVTFYLRQYGKDSLSVDSMTFIDEFGTSMRDRLNDAFRQIGLVIDHVYVTVSSHDTTYSHGSTSDDARHHLRKAEISEVEDEADLDLAVKALAMMKENQASMFQHVLERQTMEDDLAQAAEALGQLMQRGQEERTRLEPEIAQPTETSEAPEIPNPISVRTAPKFTLSFTHRKVLAKGESSPHLIILYLPSFRAETDRLKAITFGETPTSEDVVDANVEQGKSVVVELSSPGIKYTPARKVQLTEPINKVDFAGMPEDSAKPGSHTVLISVQDVGTGFQYVSYLATVTVADYAFDHVSRLKFQGTLSIMSGIGALIMWVLTLIAQIDEALGLPAGATATATTAVAGFFVYQLTQLYKTTTARFP